MANPFVLHGQAWVFGGHLGADWEICSLGRLAELKKRGVPFTAEELGKYCLENVDPEFAQCVRKGDLIVSGENTGSSTACLDYDDDDPHSAGAASIAIKGAGVGAVLCESSNMTFLMNSLNLGLPVVECRDLLAKIHQGDELEVNLAVGTIADLTTGEEVRFSAYPELLLKRVTEGGLYAHLRQEAAKAT